MHEIHISVISFISVNACMVSRCPASFSVTVCNVLRVSLSSKIASHMTDWSRCARNRYQVYQQTLSVNIKMNNHVTAYSGHMFNQPQKVMIQFTYYRIFCFKKHVKSNLKFVEEKQKYVCIRRWENTGTTSLTCPVIVLFYLKRILNEICYNVFDICIYMYANLYKYTCRVSLGVPLSHCRS